MKQTIFAIGLLLATLCGNTQAALTPPDLADQLAGKTNFFEIKAIVEQYLSNYKATNTDPNSQWFANKLHKHWYRWFIYNADRLDEQNNVTNIPMANSKALAAIKANPQLVEQANGNAQWSFIGPTDRTRIGSGHNSGLGRVNRIAFHPTDPNQIFIATPAGGLWKSNNVGATWIPLTDMLPSLGVSGIVVDWSNSNRIYILTGDGDGGNMPSEGVLVSNDGGSTWAPTGNFPIAASTAWFGMRLIQHPSQAGTLIAATTNGLYRTTNSGNTWVLEANGDFTDVAFKPGDPTIVYATRRWSSTPFMRSTNTGDTWTTVGITGVPSGSTRVALAVTPHNANYVYLLAGPATSTGNFVGVYRSTNSGESFFTRSTTPNILGYANDGQDAKHQTTYDLALAASNNNAEQIAAGGINVWSNNSGGNTGSWVRRSQWYDDSPGEYVHADIHDLAYSPHNNRLWVCSDGGVAFSDNNGAIWTRVWTGLAIMQFYHMTGFAGDANLLVGGTQDNGTNYRKSNTNNYHHIEGADGYSAIIDWSNSNRVFMSENGGLNRTDDGGDGAYNIKPAAADDCWPTIVQHPTVADTIYVGYCNGVFRSHSKGNPVGNWVNRGFRGETELVIAPTNGRRLIAASGADIRRTADGGANWVQINNKPGFNNGRILTDVTFSPNTSQLVVVSVGGLTNGQKVYRSVDFGDNWTNISYNLPNAPATAIAMDANNHIYVGMDVGVFVLPNGSNQWIPFYNYLPKTIINDFIINESAGLIRAATFGRGVWSTELFGACPANLSLVNQVYNQRYWQSSQTINSTQQIINTVGNDVFYSAGSSVTLNPGFVAYAGARFKAYIANCNNGIPSMAPLRQDYGVQTPQELFKADFNIVSSAPATANKMEVQTLAGAHKVQIQLARHQVVVLFAERMSDGEILATFIKSGMNPGAYEVDLNLEKLKNQGIALRWRIGEAPVQDLMIQ